MNCNFSIVIFILFRVYIMASDDRLVNILQPVQQKKINNSFRCPW